METRRSRALRAGLCSALFGVLCGTVAVAPPAAAATLHTILQDDDLSLFSPRTLPQYMSELRWLGVDQLRISAEWKIEAPSPDAARAPAGFRATDPGSYTGAGMALLDAAVRSAARAGISVMLDPAFSAPRWATHSSPPRLGFPADTFNTDIDARQAASWEQMLARRFSGTYTPAGQVLSLPRVDAFNLWNEPNNLTFLKPQWRGGTPVSADWYRSLVQLAYPAIKRELPSATVLIGNTSELGAAREDRSLGVAPLTFIRRLACVDRQLRPIAAGPCASFHEVPADGFAHHPYERAAPPWVRSGARQGDWAQMGDLAQLASLLDRLVKMRRLAPGARDLWLTEQGYESNAELRDRPWTEPQQAQLNAVSEYLAWREPRVRSFSQFLLRDTLTGETLARRARSGDPGANVAGTWTTGLTRQDSVAKPALWMFRSPIVAHVVPSASSLFAAGLSNLVTTSAPQLLEIWGRARPVTTPTPVQVQIRSDREHAYQTIETVSTDAKGVFDTSVGLLPGRSAGVRFRWLGADGHWQSSPITAPIVIPNAR